MINRVVRRLFRYYEELRKNISGRIKWVNVTEFNSGLVGRIVVATKNGLYVLNEGKLSRILGGEFYGITKFKDQIYVFEKAKEKGRVIILDQRFENDFFEVLIDDLSLGCHQIDIIQSKLFITDTYNNRILIYDIKGELLDVKYPIGKLKYGRSSANYGHINSMYEYKDQIYLLCHNESKKTSRKSEILKLDKELELIDRFSVEAFSAHNCVFYESELIICDSLNNSVISNNKIKFKSNFFTRGISITKTHILIGGSEYSSRSARSYASGVIFVLDCNFQLIEEISIPGMVQEIRNIDEIDLTLSQYNQQF